MIQNVTESNSRGASKARSRFTPPVSARSAADHVVRGILPTKVALLRMSTELLQDAVSHDDVLLQSMKQELSLLDDAGLHIRQTRSTPQFLRYDRSSKEETGITENQALVYSLARRSVLEASVRRIENTRRHFQKTLDAARDADERIQWEKQLRRFSDAGLDLTRILFTPEQVEWINTPYNPNPYYPEDLKHPTSAGLLTRSKSEAKIGSISEGYGLPFRYDDFTRILYDPLGDRPNRDSVYSDFKYPNLCGGITVHEHLGAFQIDRYGDNALMRLNDYHNFEVIELPGRPVTYSEFTWSFESDLWGETRIRKLFRRILLPGVDF